MNNKKILFLTKFFVMTSITSSICFVALNADFKNMTNYKTNSITAKNLIKNNFDEYTFSLKETIDHIFLRNNFASDFTFKTLIDEKILVLSDAYSKEPEHWILRKEFDDIKGELKIIELKYNNPNSLVNLPLNKVEIVSPNKPMIYTGFKNTVDSFWLNSSIHMNSILIIDSNGKLPSMIWEDYQKSLNINDVKNSLIFKSIVSNKLVSNKEDLILNPLNLNNADETGLLNYEIRIKENAILDVPYKENEKIIFTKEYEQALIEKSIQLENQGYKKIYPINVEQIIELKIFDLEWEEKFSNSSLESFTDDGAIFNLNKSDFSKKITKSLFAKEFVKNISSFENDILSTFSYNKDFIPSINKSNITYSNFEGWVRIEINFDFNYGDTNNLRSKKIQKNIEIIGFNIGNKHHDIIILICISLILFMSIALIVIFIAINQNKKNNELNNNLNAKKTSLIKRPSQKKLMKYIESKKKIELEERKKRMSEKKDDHSWT